MSRWYTYRFIILFIQIVRRLFYAQEKDKNSMEVEKRRKVYDIKWCQSFPRFAENFLHSFFYFLCGQVYFLFVHNFFFLFNLARQRMYILVLVGFTSAVGLLFSYCRCYHFSEWQFPPLDVGKKKRFNTAFWTGKKKSGFVFPLLHLLSLSSLTHIFFFIYLQLKVKGMLLSHV